MKSISFRVLLYLSLCSLLLVTVNSQQTVHAGIPLYGIPIGAANVMFDSTVVPADGTRVRAFIATGSASSICMVTLNESNFAVAGATVFCGARVLNGQNGVLVSVFFPQQIENVGSGLVLTANVYQQGATRYGAPIHYSEEQ
jgi:hypothetical protein